MTVLLPLALACYFMSGVLSVANSTMRRDGKDVALFRYPALAAGFVAAVVNALWIASQWGSLGYPPFAELFGCLVLLAFCVGVTSLTLELLLGIRFLGGLSSLAAAVVLMVATRFSAESHPLPPALQSVYFVPHVVSYFIAYGALTVSGLASLALLVARSFSRTRTGPFAVEAEAWAARSAQIGFPFLTLGLVLGAVWAQAAYTDYWTWDPKEVWALATWLLVSAWLMVRMNGRRGALTNLLMVVAVAAMYFTLFGVNFLPAAQQSLHTYTMR